MTKFLKLVFLLSVFILSSSFNLLKNNNTVEQGNVIYTFESGKMQCLSEVNLEGEIVVLIKSLKENTHIEFNKVEFNKQKKMVIVLLMQVEEENNLCAGWINMQEVRILIDPQPVQKITLTGKAIYKADNLTVLEAK